MNRWTSYRELCKQILDIYTVLLDDLSLKLDNSKFETVLKNIMVLKKVRDNDKLSVELFSSAEIFDFLHTLLDSYGMAYASGSENLSISKRQLIGSGRAISGNLKEDHVRNFQFSKLFQGWWNNGHKDNPIKDLAAGSSPNRGGICDYAIELKCNDVELVECKRIHPHPLKRISFEKLADKMIIKIGEAQNQLSKTADRLSTKGKGVLCSTFLLDISPYSNPEEKKVINGFKVSGFTEEELKEIKTLVISRNFDRKVVDRIGICWSQVVYKENLPIAIR